MLWMKLGWRNLWRNRRRSIIELASIGGSVFLCVAWNNLAVGTYAKMIEDGVKMGSGHIGIYHRDYLELRKTEQTVPADDLIPSIEAEPDVAAVFPRLQVPGLVRSSRENRAGGIMGLDFERERDTNPLLAEKRIVEGGLPMDNLERGALVGADMARELSIGVGNKFVVMMQGADGEIVSALLRVSGIVKTNMRMIDAGTVIMDRHRLGEIIGTPGAAHEIGIMLTDHARIRSALPGLEAIADRYGDAKAFQWRDAMPELASAVEMDYAGLKVMVAFLYIIVGIGTINTLLMSVMERTREFGVLRAMGLNSAGIRKMVLSEAVVLATAGVIVGLALSIAAGLYTSTHGIDFSGIMGEGEQEFGGTLFEPIMYSIWDVRGMILLAVGMVVVALLASLYPAHRAMKVRPADAMRHY